MERDTDIVLQGPMFKETWQLAECYASMPFVNRVIISTWDDDQGVPSQRPDNIRVVTSPYPENGTGNMNLQIVSSAAGLKLCEAKYAIKMRSDQIVFRSSMHKLDEFFRNQIQRMKFANWQGPEGPVCVIGMSKVFPFHPQDHIFWGHTQDVKKVFDIPLMPSAIRRVGNNFAEELRCVIYLGAHYCARFDPLVYKFLADPKKYLVDAAPCKQEALEVSERIRDQAFKVFPRFDMHWVKYNSPYWYGSYEQQGEYYAD